MAEEQLVGKVSHVYSQIQVAIVDLTKPIKVGDSLHFKGAKDDFHQLVTQMQFDHKNIDKAKAGLQVGLKTEQPAHENDLVYKSK